MNIPLSPCVPENLVSRDGFSLLIYIVRASVQESLDTTSDFTIEAFSYRVWASTCPFLSRSMMLVLVTTFFLSLVLPNLSWALQNSVDLTIHNYEVYRLVTSVFGGHSMLGLVFGLMSFNQVGPKMESSLGSSGLLALMVTMTVCTNLFFLAVCYLLFFLGEARAPFYSSGGVWNLLICLITVECMATPEQTRRFWIVPVDIPSKFYPLVLVFVFGLMRSTLLDLLCSAAVGYAYATGRMDRLKPSRSRLAGWESGCLSNFVNYSGYIVNGAARGQEAFGMPLNNPADHPSNQRGDDRGGESNSGFSLFRRGRAGTEEGQGGGGDGAGTGDGGGSGAGFGSKNVIKRGGAGGGGRDSFAGSGQTLGGGGGGTRMSSSRSSQAQHDPETARQARLAALEGRGVVAGGRGEGGDPGEVATPLLHPSGDDVRALQEMGYSEEESREALQRNDGDLEAAAAYLTA